MELFVIIVNGYQPLAIIIKCSILDIAAVLDGDDDGDPPIYYLHIKQIFPENEDLTLRI